ncbi:hypothetical protein NX868_08430 [Burkholderia thailandensis]|uniref:hypothetical protein n=1 Tax=Burkholderia thailandensis TaxID=57975 RepID=UPI0012D2FD71|nr:hypothetical protein [Burkholderia thailandensis]MCS3392076.1 hypothetical protein [Burkholderia thailandensis]MCS6425134.1 hypothetical protein [Burkholderia thailandensis]MCS6453146.1 hypothetical protein [Burkholderia thailandensis]MCS6464533.1 hypothetical protein [Burkholderia thailandensis]MCS6482303.1 hypothetical protein [Burkholderia thailandensis]
MDGRFDFSVDLFMDFESSNHRASRILATLLSIRFVMSVMLVGEREAACCGGHALVRCERHAWSGALAGRARNRIKDAKNMQINMIGNKLGGRFDGEFVCFE